MTDENQGTTDTPETGSDESDPLTLELERINTLLATTENSLREMENERNRERILREKYEKDIVLLKGDVNRLERDVDAVTKLAVEKDGLIAKEAEKRRQAVERADRLKAEADTLRRAKTALEKQVEAADAAVLDASMNGPRPAPESQR